MKEKKNWRFHYHTHDAIRTYFENNDLVIIPTGSCEQHGLHLPLITDALIPEYMADKVAEREGALVLPVLPYGNSSNHECFPGTVTVEPNTYMCFVRDITMSLIRHGARRILFVNGHSGNTASLQQVCDYAREQGVFACIADWFSIIGQLDPYLALSGHGDYVEASAMLFLYPALVRLEKAKPYQQARLSPDLKFIAWDRLCFKGAVVHTWVKTQDASPQGNLGTLNGTSPETGERIFTLMVDFLCELVREIKTVDLTHIRATLYKENFS